MVPQQSLHKAFNPTLVQFKPEPFIKIFKASFPFNPTLVQFKQGDNVNTEVVEMTFQSYLSPI